MRVSIIKDDNTVYVDGIARHVDCTSLPQNFWALQWEGNEAGTEGEGEVEFRGKPKPPNDVIHDITPYMPLIHAHQSA